MSYLYNDVCIDGEPKEQLFDMKCSILDEFCSFHFKNFSLFLKNT